MAALESLTGSGLASASYAVLASAGGGLGIFRDLVIVMAACLGAVMALRSAKVPTLVAFLAAGIVIGPGGLKLVTSEANIAQLGEIGVVFLLFTIGLQFSIRDLLQMKRLALLGGGLQVGLTMLATTIVGVACGMDVAHASFLGALLAMSSTAILLRLLEESGETASPHGRFMLAVLIFQDLAVVPIMLFLPLWGGGGGQDASQAWILLGKTLGLLAALFLTARFVFPWLLERVVGMRSREAFTLATLLGAMGTAWLCGEVGVSLALGAFLAGIVLAESPYAHQVMSEITPLRDALGCLFFASVGMLVEPKAWLEAPLLTLGLLGAVLLLKIVPAFATARFLGLSTRSALPGAFGLAQVGEFSLVLAGLGAAAGVFDTRHQPAFLSVAVLSMALTPLLLRLAPRLAAALHGRRAAASASHAGAPDDAHGSHGGQGGGHGGGHGGGLALEDHVIVVGYGVTGRNVTRFLQRHGVHHVVLELNPATVKRIRGEVEHVMYGDATQEGALVYAGVRGARVLVVAVPDPAGARQIVAVARKLRPDLVILARTRLVAEVDALRRLGAQDVVPEEFETSLELAGRVLAAYGVSDRIVAREKGEVRRERYALLLEGAPPPPPAEDLDTLLAEVDVATFAALASSPVVGRSLRDLDLRRRLGVTVLAVTRGGASTPNPDPSLAIAAGDLLAVMGRPEQLRDLRLLLEGEGPLPAAGSGG
jgi:CPA2 family monovalent cation:H+ antiporter-2